MTSNYPASIDTIPLPNFSWAMGDTRRSQSSLIIDLRDSIRAIETELGLNPHGGSASVSARLDNLRDRIDTLQANIAQAPSSVMAMAWSIPGNLSPGLIGMGYPLIGHWKFKAMGLMVNNAPSSSGVGGPLIINVYHNTVALYTDATRPRIAAGNRDGTQLGAPLDNDYVGTMNNPIRFAISVDEIGSGPDPGADLVVVVYVEAA